MASVDHGRVIHGVPSGISVRKLPNGGRSVLQTKKEKRIFSCHEWEWIAQCERQTPRLLFEILVLKKCHKQCEASFLHPCEFLWVAVSFEIYLSTQIFCLSPQNLPALLTHDHKNWSCMRSSFLPAPAVAEEHSIACCPHDIADRHLLGLWTHLSFVPAQGSAQLRGALAVQWH